MAKDKRKAERSCSTYHIDSVNLEIDYEKLAEAIVKANNTAEAKKRQSKPQQNRPFWKKIWEIWSNKRDTDGQFMAATFSSIISVFFKTIAIASVVIAGFLLIIGLKYGVFELTWTWENIIFNIIFILAIVVVSFLIFLFATVFWGASNEIDREQDKNYILSVFSGIVALLTLISSLVALYGRG